MTTAQEVESEIKRLEEKLAQMKQQVKKETPMSAAKSVEGGLQMALRVLKKNHNWKIFLGMLILWLIQRFI